MHRCRAHLWTARLSSQLELWVVEVFGGRQRALHTRERTLFEAPSSAAAPFPSEYFTTPPSCMYSPEILSKSKFQVSNSSPANILPLEPNFKFYIEFSKETLFRVLMGYKNSGRFCVIRFAPPIWSGRFLERMLAPQELCRAKTCIDVPP